MGNRIHTTLGYGLKKVRWKKDRRINPEFWENLDNEIDILPAIRSFAEKQADSFDNDSLLARLDCRGWYIHDKPIQSLCISDCISFSGYISETKGAPIIFHDFIDRQERYDDLIDYYAFSSKKGPMDKVKMITDQKQRPAGIYPHMNYVNSKTGEPVPCSPSDRWIRNDEDSAKLYNMTVDQWVNDVVPQIPYNIRVFCEVANVFVNPLDVYSLRAMLYTYWC